MSTQLEKARAFKALHSSGKLLFLPNIWDVAGARLLEELSFPAVATASAAVSRSLGYEDGEHIPFDKLCWLLERIVQNVQIPVTADIEAGFAADLPRLKENIGLVLDCGIVGINFEDTIPRTQQLYPIDVQVSRLRAVREAADTYGIPLYINARVDVFVRLSAQPPETQLQEALARAGAYRSAGADGIYPIGVKNQETIKALVKGIAAPINIGSGGQDLKALAAMGVARVSMGPGFQTMTLKAMKEKAAELANF
jgi:2-methylisocitrate lyase-like PEP mutase family enzyme